MTNNQTVWLFGLLKFGDWNLFGVCILVIGYYIPYLIKEKDAQKVNYLYHFYLVFSLDK